ncbi:PREDICTED: uncharacterized protein LOC108379084 isoform X3 [Rhagoletis zephyria]|uniref:uncharacterized protein LOC108379084 isoform X3 n=1 Tax=Rhagoletis zephyria TaxID=28612 RepID=UPI00081140D3|nr:PREDICTED: uncharacterized protein LOC108379084 isoform X3 [Rhagoletis zephyria]
MEFNISQKEQEIARPRIVHASPGTPQVMTPIAATTTTAPTDRKPSFVGTPTEGNATLINTPPGIISNAVKQEIDVKNPVEMTPLFEKIKLECRENNEMSQEQNDSNISLAAGGVTKKSPWQELAIESNSLANELRMLPPTHDKKIPPSLDVQPGRSILSKKRDDLAAKENSEKIVQFSAQGPTVHDISANVSIDQDPSSNDNVNKEVKNKVYIKQVRTKSNIIVRRVIVSSKREPT